MLIALRKRQLENKENHQIADAEKIPVRKTAAMITDKAQLTTISFLRVEVEAEKQNLLEYLKKNYKGKIGKDIAIMILALKEAGMIEYNIRKVLYSALREDFGYIGKDQAINNYMILNNSGNIKKDKDYIKIVSEHAERIKIYNNK